MSQPDDFVREFLVESREGLDQLDSDLVALESNPDDTARFDSAFRVLHTIKGNAGFLDFPKLGQLAHAGETLLGRLRSGERLLDSMVVDALLEMLDTFRRTLNTIESTGSEGNVTFEELGHALLDLSKGESIVAVPRKADSDIRPPADDDTEPDADLSTAAGPDSDPSIATVTFSPQQLEELAESDVVDSGAGDANDAPGSTNMAGVPEHWPDPLPAAATEDGEARDVPAREKAPPEKTPPPTPEPEPDPPPVAASQKDDSGTERRKERSGDSSIPSKSVPAASAASSLVRVDVDLLDRLMNLVGELVLARNQIVQIVTNRSDPELLNPIQRLNLLTTDLQEGVLKTRMQQIGSIWQRYPRMVRDFAKMCGKEVELTLAGAETELDKSLVESITDPLIHLIRNAIDHGIEKPYLRKVKKKPRTGQLALKASHEAGQVVIQITDDGSGLDLKRIRQKAVERGLFSEEAAQQLDESDVRDSIFLPGFSTADQISNVSGRGVGMDVVKTHIERVGGTIEIDTEKDVGTTFRLTVPLTLAIIPALMVTTGGQQFAVPQTNVVEMLALQNESDQAIELFHDTPVLRLRGDVLPVISLAEQLKVADLAESDSTSVMILKTGTRQFGLLVDSIGNSQEIVVKPFGQVLDGMSEYGGATIMGDGSVALILDVRGIAQRAGLFATDRSLLQAAERGTEEREVVVEDSLLVAEVSERHRIGLPLAEVIRLEEIPAFQVEISGGREVIQYRGEILPLIRIFDLLPDAPDTSDVTAQPDVLSVVIYQCAERTIGLIVRRIVDIAEAPQDVQPAQEPGVITATTVTGGCVTDLIDVSRLLDAAGLTSPTA